MSVSKRYLKKKPVCKTTFRLPAEAAQGAEVAHLVGDFNDWDENATPMQKLKDGSFKVILDLDAGREYEYRYLLDNTTWENDWEADKYVPSPLGASDNSVVVL